MKEPVRKIMYFTPYFHQNRGNSTTARRIQFGLTEAGICVSVFAYEEEPFCSEVQRKLNEADVVHILHFARFLTWSERNNVMLVKPYVVTSGGTDINQSLVEKKEKYLHFLRKAKAITVFTDEAKRKLVDQYGFKENHIHVIPQSIYLPPSKWKEKEKLSLPEGNPKLLLVAGLRPVKDVLFALPVIKELLVDFPGIVFLLLGTKLDEKIYERVLQETGKNEWFIYKPEIDLSSMHEVYDWADIVLNTSISEGQSTSIIEAMNQQKPVAARMNSGNSSIIKDNINGILFSDSIGLYNGLKRLMTDRKLYEKLRLKGYQTVQKNHSLEKEIKAYIHLYEQ